MSRGRSVHESVVLVCVLAAATGACAPSGDPQVAPVDAVAPSAGALEPPAGLLASPAEPAAPEPPVDPASLPLPDFSQQSDRVQEQIRERLAALEEAIARKAPAAELGRAHGELGLILSAAGFEEAGMPRLLHAQELAPEEFLWPYFLGYFHFEGGDLQKAKDFFERAVELRPDYVPAMFRLGKSYLDLGHAADAQPLFQEALEMEPDSSALHGWLGRAALALGDHAQAVEHLERALALEPRATRFHYSLALAYRALGDSERADAHLRQRGDGEPPIFDSLVQTYYWLLETAQTYHQRALAALSNEDYAMGVELLRRGLELEPENAGLGYLLGSALYRNGELDAAIAQLEHHNGLYPDHADAQYLLGMMYIERESYRDALPRLEAAVRHDPKHAGARMALAEYLAVMGRLEDALGHWERVMELEPRFVEAWTQSADLLVRLNRYEEAAARLAGARERFPDRPDVARAHEMVEAVAGLRR